ncbi:MAG: hypothetical protein HYZ44_00190 [Bacteroidetes bacterium]|nr:hypothetical protein [Bacteroidota bacterium]
MAISKTSTLKLPNWLLYAWFLFFILNPFLVFGSGMPQPADWIMALLFMYIFFRGLKPLPGVQSTLVDRHRMFVIYVAIVNTIWYFFIDQSFEKRFPTFVHSFFYIFNFFALRSIVVLSRAFKDRFLTYTTYGIGLGMIIQVALSFAMGSLGTRNSLFFNNPNQLGYYALLSGSLFIYAVRYVKMPIYFQLISYFCFFFLTLLSSSKAALAGSLILITLAVLNQGLFSIRQFIVLAIAITIGGFFISQQELGTKLFNYSLNRFQTIGESKDDSYEGRGYDRIVNDPEYMILGAGEGGYNRFSTLLDAGEIHSSFGTLIFCYGIIGFTFFIRFLLAIFNKSTFFELMYFLPIFAYSITHNGLRDTLFWIFLGVVFLLNEQKLVSVTRKVSNKIRMPKRRFIPKVEEKIN